MLFAPLFALEDVLGAPHLLKRLQNDKYLGDVISVDGKNFKNIEAKVSKAIGIAKTLKNYLEDMCLGPFYFEVALILRNSLFLNGILTNLEVSYGLTNEELTKLEQMDEALLRTILECPVSVPKEMLYLEMGATPLRYIVMSRRLVYYHYVITQSEDALIRKFYNTQKTKPTRNDWCLTVKDNLETIGIKYSESEIQNMSSYKLKKLTEQSYKKTRI